jgi:hypothetical protein
MLFNIKECLLQHSYQPKIHLIDRYIKLINYCKTINFSGYTETHHIIPRSFGGGDKDNLLKLDARYHFIAHLLLAKATGNPKMIKALHRMTYSHSKNVQRNYKITNRIYSYLKEEHSKIVSKYSKNTVVARHLSGEIKRIPKKLFDYYNGTLYEAISKGRKDSSETIAKKKIASCRPRKVKQKSRLRSLSASLYSYKTPLGFCENRQDLLKLYPSFSIETLTCIRKNNIISKKFVSIHLEFKPFLGKRWSDIGFERIKRKKHG